MGNFIKKILKTNGRWNRKKYIIFSIILSIIISALSVGIFILFIFMAFGGGLSYSLVYTIFGLGGIIIILSFYIQILANINRLHDLNKTGWLTLLMFIPLINIGFFIYLIFFEGTTGKNQYGDNPLGGKNTNNNEPEIVNNTENIVEEIKVEKKIEL